MPENSEKLLRLALLGFAIALPVLPSELLLALIAVLLLTSLRISQNRDLLISVFILFLITLEPGMEYYILGSSIILSVILPYLRFSVTPFFTLVRLLSSVATLFLTLSLLIFLGGCLPNFSYVLFLSIIAGMVSTLLDLITRRNKETITLLGSSMSMWLFVSFGHPIETSHLLSAFVLSLAVGYLSCYFGAMDEAGMVSGALIGAVIILFSDLRWFLLMLLFFLLGGIFTKYKYDVKFARGMAEERSGRRSYNNVFGNGLSPLCSSVLYGITQNELFAIFFVSSLATVAADTLGSEIGGLSKREPRMITSLRKVPHGTNGGVTPLGEFATFLGSSVMSLSSLILRVSDEKAALIILLSGFIGAHVDSLLGATLENRGIIGNSAVNLLASLSGGIIGSLLYLYST